MQTSEQFSSSGIPRDSQLQRCCQELLGVSGRRVVVSLFSGRGTVQKDELMSILSGIGITDRELPGKVVKFLRAKPGSMFVKS